MIKRYTIEATHRCKGESITSVFSTTWDTRDEAWALTLGDESRVVTLIDFDTVAEMVKAAFDEAWKIRADFLSDVAADDDYDEEWNRSQAQAALAEVGR